MFVYIYPITFGRARISVSWGDKENGSFDDTW